MINLSHNWSNYSIASSKCGFNLKKKDNGGNISIIDLQTEYLSAALKGAEIDLCKLVYDRFCAFMKETKRGKPVIVMIDDLSIFSSIGYDNTVIHQLIRQISNRLREDSSELTNEQLNHMIIQSSDDLRGLIQSLRNSSDIYMVIRPLETGHSTVVDGTLRITDIRLPNDSGNKQIHSTLSFAQPTNIGCRRSFFYKLGDRRVRLTTSAPIL